MVALTINKEILLPALLTIIGAVDKKQTLPILNNILFVFENNTLRLTATDLEIEMSVKLLCTVSESGSITVPAKKMIDIIRSLEDGTIVITFAENHAIIQSYYSKFKIMTLPAVGFPAGEYQNSELEFAIERTKLIYLLYATHFALAQQDVRVFLNVLLFEINNQVITTVATDGHRMAIAKLSIEYICAPQQLLLPRRGVLEMLRVLNNITDAELTITAGKGYFRIHTEILSFITKLTETRFPMYTRAIPVNNDKFVIMERDALKRALARIVILANEKSHAVLLHIQPGFLTLIANNQAQEEAQEQIAALINGNELKIGVNSNYLLDVLNHLPNGALRLSFSTIEQSILIEMVTNADYQYIIMPMKI